MREVQVLQATKTAPNSRGRNKNYAVQIDRIRVAAYCRVSTDGDEQLGSFESQKLYYEEKIRKNKEWAMAGIFADEAITGTKIDKREGFQEMIRKCLNGEIDMILTQGSLHSAVCWNVGIVVISYPEGQGIRQLQRKNLSGSV